MRDSSFGGAPENERDRDPIRGWHGDSIHWIVVGRDKLPPGRWRSSGVWIFFRSLWVIKTTIWMKLMRLKKWSCLTLNTRVDKIRISSPLNLEILTKRNDHPWVLPHRFVVKSPATCNHNSLVSRDVEAVWRCRSNRHHHALWGCIGKSRVAEMVLRSNLLIFKPILYSNPFKFY